MAENYRIIPAPVRGINLSVPEQRLDPQDMYAQDVVNMLPTREDTLRKRPGFGFFSSVSEEAVPLEIFEFGSITDTGLTPVVIWIGHRKLYIVSKIIFFPDDFGLSGRGLTFIDLIWHKVQDSTGYEIQWKLAAQRDWESEECRDQCLSTQGAPTNLPDVLTQTVAGLSQGTRYDFRMRAVRTIAGKTTHSIWTKTISVLTEAIPTVPSSLRSIARDRSSITMDWNEVTHELPVTYGLRYKVKGAKSWAQTLTAITDTSRKVTGLNAGVQYEFQVMATAGGRDSDWSDSVIVATVDPLPDPPAIPGGRTVDNPTNAKGTLRARWNASLRATQYTVRYRKRSHPTDTWPDTLTTTSTSITVTGLDDSERYDFQVQASNEGGRTNFSATFSGITKLATPSISGVTTTRTSFTARWGAIALAQSYNLRYREKGKLFNQVVGITGTSRKQSGLPKGTEYEIQVQAVRSGGNTSDWSTLFSTETDSLAKPDIPTGLAGTVGRTSLAMSWTKVSNATSYDLRHRKVGAQSWVEITDISGTSRSITGLSSSTQYEIQVRASNEGGDSDWSASVKLTTSSAPISVPEIWGPWTEISRVKSGGTICLPLKFTGDPPAWRRCTDYYTVTEVRTSNYLRRQSRSRSVAVHYTAFF